MPILLELMRADVVPFMTPAAAVNDGCGRKLGGIDANEALEASGAAKLTARALHSSPQSPPRLSHPASLGASGRWTRLRRELRRAYHRASAPKPGGSLDEPQNCAPE